MWIDVVKVGGSSQVEEMGRKGNKTRSSERIAALFASATLPHFPHPRSDRFSLHTFAAERVHGET